MRERFLDHTCALMAIFYSVSIGILIKIFATEVRLPYFSPLLFGGTPTTDNPFSFASVPNVFVVFVAFIALDWFSGWVGLERVREKGVRGFAQPFLTATSQAIGVILLGLSASFTLIGSRNNYLPVNPYRLIGLYALVSVIWTIVVIYRTPWDPRDEVYEIFNVLFRTPAASAARRVINVLNSLQKRADQKFQILSQQGSPDERPYGRIFLNLSTCIVLRLSGFIAKIIQNIIDRVLLRIFDVLAILMLVWYVLGLLLLYDPLHPGNDIVFFWFIVFYFYATGFTLLGAVRRVSREALISGGTSRDEVPGIAVSK